MALVLGVKSNPSNTSRDNKKAAKLLNQELKKGPDRKSIQAPLRPVPPRRPWADGDPGLLSLISGKPISSLIQIHLELGKSRRCGCTGGRSAYGDISLSLSLSLRHGERCNVLGACCWLMVLPRFYLVVCFFFQLLHTHFT